MSNSADKPTPFYERDLRRAMAHVRHAFHLVQALGDLIEDDFGNVEVQESLRAAYEDVKEFGRCQFGMEFGRKGARQ
jgi:hypothetical protein